MKRFLAIVKWFFIVVIGLMVVAAASGAVYQRIAQARDMEAYPPPGQLVDVDGRKMHIHCQGQGSPTVLIEQALTAPAVFWTDVNEEMSRHSRVCAYDRAGLGYSEPLGRPLSAPDVADRLNKLLQNADIDDDLVLVGWSAGGVYIREYYSRYPERVKGMVLVDASHEQQNSRMPAWIVALDGITTRATVMKFLAPLGVPRITGMIEQSVHAPEHLKQRLVAQMSQSHHAAARINEKKGFMKDLAQNKVPTSLGDVPLLVLSRGNESAFETWNVLQEELTALSTRGRRIVATQSGHAIHDDDPQLLIDSVNEMVDIARVDSVSGE